MALSGGSQAPVATALPRSPGLDALRAFACALVILFHLHTVGHVGFGPLDPLVAGGDSGVYIFFVLSGYLLYRPFVGRHPNLGSYAIKRAARILPGYFVALGSLVLLTGSRLPASDPIPYLTLASSYSIPLRQFLGSSWTLSAEVIFYVAVPVVALIADGRQRIVLGAIAILSMVSAVWLRATLSTDTEWLIGSFPFVFYAFVPGMALAVLERMRPTDFRRLSAWPTLVFGLTYVVLGTLSTVLPIALGPTLGAALLIGWLLHRQFPGARTFAFLGGMSYAAYLWHKDLLIAFGVGGLALALIGAACSWALIERPILQLAHSVASGPRSRSDAERRLKSRTPDVE